MIALILLSAVVLQAVGHFFKACRWKQILSVYEEVNRMDLVNEMMIGQGINMAIPYRMGDLFRIWHLGKFYLENGYILALASVMVDLFIDTITVGLAFMMLYVLEIHEKEIFGLTVVYGLLSLFVVFLSVFAIKFKKNVKKLIQKFSGLFNETIERRMLSVSYTVLVSIKDIFKKKNVYRLLIYTAGVWSSYFISYGFFAVFLQEIGYDFTLTGVFGTIFSMTGNALFVECVKKSYDLSWMIWFLIYLFLPLCCILIVVLIYKKIKRKESVKKKCVRIVPQLNAREKLAFLTSYFSDEDREYFNNYLSINSDVSVVRDCSAGSHATTILCIKKGKTFYRKYAFGQYVDDLWKQIEWLEEFKKVLPVTKIIYSEKRENYGYFDMEYCSEAVTYFNYIHSKSDEDNWRVLENVLECLNKKLYCSEPLCIDDGMIQEYVDAKVINNLEICHKWLKKYYPNLESAKHVAINGKKYKNLSEYVHLFKKENLVKVFSVDRASRIHGDLTIENIICINGEMHHNWYLIDPNARSVYNTPFMDYAKLLQSLHGMYEFLMLVNQVKISENLVEFLFTGSMAYRNLYERYKIWLSDHYSREEVKSIYFHEAVHWLRLMPYKIEKNPKNAIIFYAGMIMVLADIEEMFKDEEKETGCF